MIKELIATIGIISTIGTNPPLNANDETYYQDVTITETYEYETNEVNSFDDLVVGNIYHFEINEINLNQFSYNSIIEIGNSYNYELTSNSTITNFYSSSVLRIQIQDRILYFVYGTNDILLNQKVGVQTSGTITFKCDFIFESDYQNTIDLITYISASDYLGEKTITITPHETEGLYNLGYHFLVTRIYTNGELASMNVSIFGTTLNVNQWLAHTTALAVTIMLLIVLIKFVIWLFKIVSGTFIWR